MADVLRQRAQTPQFRSRKTGCGGARAVSEARLQCGHSEIAVEKKEAAWACPAQVEASFTSMWPQRNRREEEEQAAALPRCSFYALGAERPGRRRAERVARRAGWRISGKKFRCPLKPRQDPLEIRME